MPGANLGTIVAAGGRINTLDSITNPVTVTGTINVNSITVSSIAATVTVSGAVTSNQGAPNSAANAWPVLVSDGSNTLGVSAHPVRTDPTGTTTQPVSGTFWQATQPVSGTVGLSAGQGVEVLDGGGTNKLTVSAGGAAKVDGSAVTQPVSGTFWQATQPVSGTFWQATQPVSGTVGLTAGQAVELLDSGGTNKASISAGGALKVDGSAFTMTVSGSVSVSSGSVNIGTITGNVSIVNATGTQIGMYAPAQLVYSGNLAGLSSTVEPGSPLTAGGRTLMVTFSTVGSLSSLTIVGNGSGVVYAAWAAGEVNIGLVGVSYIPFDSTVDSQVKLTGTGPGTVSIYALGEAVAQAGAQVANIEATNSNVVWMGARYGAGQALKGLTVDSGTNLNVNIANAGANPVTVTLTSTTITGTVACTQSGTWNIGTVTTVTAVTAITNALPAGSNTIGAVNLAAISGLKTAVVDAAIAANATSSIVAGSGSKVITVYGFAGSIAAAAATAGIYVARVRSDSTSVPVAAAVLRVLQATAVGIAGSGTDLTAMCPSGGFALPAGEGVQVFADNQNAASIDVAGVLYYTQI
jgi:hypothetical protein